MCRQHIYLLKVHWQRLLLLQRNLGAAATRPSHLEPCQVNCWKPVGKVAEGGGLGKATWNSSSEQLRAGVGEKLGEPTQNCCKQAGKWSERSSVGLPVAPLGEPPRAGKGLGRPIQSNSKWPAKEGDGNLGGGRYRERVPGWGGRKKEEESAGVGGGGQKKTLMG